MTKISTIEDGKKSSDSFTTKNQPPARDQIDQHLWANQLVMPVSIILSQSRVNQTVDR